jgi:hypothetical protein
MTTDERADDAGDQDAPAGSAVEEEPDAEPAVDVDEGDEDDGDESDSDESDDEPAGEDGDGPDWWHRDHPVFTPLAGFFTGLVTVVLLPGLYAALLSQFFDNGTAADLFPFVAVLLVVPLALMAAQRTRRFGRYMLAGMLLTALVVVAVGALTLWILVQLDS